MIGLQYWTLPLLIYLFFLKSKSFSHYFHVIKTCYSPIARWIKKSEQVYCFFLRITQMPLYLYTSDFILSLCLWFFHRYQSDLKLTSSFDSCVSDSNFIPSLLNSRYFLPSIFFSHFCYLNSSVVYLNIKWVFACKVFCSFFIYLFKNLILITYLLFHLASP